MSSRTVQFLVASVITLGAWSIGRAQSQAADFEILIDAPAGRVNITCVRGCQWGDVAQLGKPHTTAFWCGGSDRCSGVVDGRGIVVRHAR